MSPNVSCTHTIARHVHGTRACYVLDRCRCTDCRTANNTYTKKRNRWLGEYPWTPPPLVSKARARVHILDLMGQGMGQKRIAQVADVADSVVGSIVWGRHDREAVRIRYQTEEALLAVELVLADGKNVPADEAWQIVAELRYRGWWGAEIGRRITGPKARSLQMGDSHVYVSTLKTLRGLLNETVPARVHNPTGRTYTPKPDYEWNDVAPSTPGVPAVSVHSAWRRQRDLDGLRRAVDMSISDHLAPIHTNYLAFD